MEVVRPVNLLQAVAPLDLEEEKVILSPRALQALLGMEVASVQPVHQAVPQALVCVVCWLRDVNTGSYWHKRS